MLVWERNSKRKPFDGWKNSEYWKIACFDLPVSFSMTLYHLFLNINGLYTNKMMSMCTSILHIKVLLC